MIRRLIASLAGVAALTVVSVIPLVAHEGHDHKVLGTVTIAAADHLMVKDNDNKDVTVYLTRDTKVTKDKKAMKVEDIKVGLRVVITATTVKENNVEKMVAKQVELGAAQSPRLVATALDESAAVAQWLGTYDAALNAKDLETLATFYHPDVTIYEGTGVNNGWADYRDRHLGPELKAFQNLQFTHSDTKVTVHAGGQSAYAISRYTLKAKMTERDIDSEGLASYVLIKGSDGAWQIRHSHTSSRARRPAAK